VTEKPGGRKLSQIKLMRNDPVGIEAQAEEIKAKYAKIFGV
jgi:iron(III) transport system substrate-binding protein